MALLIFFMCPIAFILFFVLLASAAWPALLVILGIAVVATVIGLAARAGNSRN